MIENSICPLCSSNSNIFFTTRKTKYHQCVNCKGIFVDKNCLPDKNAEKARYSEHNNDVNDVGYQQFVSPIVNSVQKYFDNSHSGLDFGAGTGPVISKMLTESGYKIELYDPFFHNNPELLSRKYDYIVSCEVIEHFHNPAKEFRLLKSMLNSGGKLICMTNIIDENIDFKNWYYKNDSTHVFFYYKDTFTFIKEKYGFTDLQIENNLIVFTN